MVAKLIQLDDPTTAPTEDDQDAGTTPMLVVAFVGGLPVATLSLESDPEEDTDTVSTSGTESRTNTVPPRLSLEVDSKYPPRLVEDSYAPTAVAASCRYRIYPAGGGVSTTATTGASTLAQAGLILPVKETLVFSNSGTVNLKYKPAGGVTIIPIGDFVDQWGNTFSPSMIAPGGTVETVQWINSNTYSDPKPRKLTEYEIAAVNLYSKLTVCWGLVSVEYSTTYDLHEFIFEKDNTNSNLVSFKDSFVFAIHSNKVAGQLQIQAPSTKGKK